MTPATSLRDTWLVARFELLRNLRTWRALAMCTLYLIVVAGGCWLFLRGILAAENALADTLRVPQTDTPGAMLDQLLKEPRARAAIASIVGEEAWVDHILAWPILAVFHLWLATGVIPFLAASVASEAVSVDMKSRALRFEVLRTGRLELVSGRMLGQVLLMGVASALSITATWSLGMLAMVGNDPWRLFTSLVEITPRVWAITLPFLGLGLSCSQVFTSPNVGRMVALLATALSWIGYATAHKLRTEGDWPALWDVALSAFPQTWMTRLWGPGTLWLEGGLVLAALGIFGMGLALPWFMRRDL